MFKPNAVTLFMPDAVAVVVSGAVKNKFELTLKTVQTYKFTY